METGHVASTAEADELNGNKDRIYEANQLSNIIENILRGYELYMVDQ